MRRITITRDETGPEGTFGKLVTDLNFECYTLERPAEGDHPCIPKGVYKVLWTNTHPIHGECYEVMNVPARTAILIHSANWFDQLLGCIAPGRSVQDVEGVWQEKPRKMKGVTSSKDALKGLIENMDKKEFELTIR